MPERIDHLTPEQEAQMDGWADRWIEVGLRTGPIDRERWERGAKACYGFAGLEWPANVIEVPNPLVLCIAGPMASYLLESGAVAGAVLGELGAVDGAVRDAIYGAVHGAVPTVVNGAVDVPVVRDAIYDAVSDKLRLAMEDATGAYTWGRAALVRLAGSVSGEVDSPVRDMVARIVYNAVSDVVSGAVHGAMRVAVDSRWMMYLGGQFWVGGWWAGTVMTSFVREVCGLQLPGDLWDRARAWEDTVESACLWWPHRRFTMVCARPSAIHTELVDPRRPRGWGSHRLHCATGAAVAWDGWGVYAWHGVPVPREVIEAPETLRPVEDILRERNAEVRRVKIERFGFDRLVKAVDAERLDDSSYGTLWRVPFDDDEPLVVVEVEDATADATGAYKRYMLRVPPSMTSAHEAVAWTFGLTADEYDPAVQT